MLRLSLIFTFKFISHPSYRLNTVNIQLASKIHDVDIDSLFISCKIISPYLIDEVISGQHLISMFHKYFQYIKFQLCKIYFFPIYFNGMSICIQLDTMRNKNVVIFYFFFKTSFKENGFVI